MSVAYSPAEKQPTSIILPYIPSRLRANRSHVTWRREARKDGTIGKVPYNAHEYLNGKTYRASSTRAYSWSTYRQAVAALRKSNGFFDGTGIVLQNDLTAYDIDHCIDRTTGAIHPAAREIVDATVTYWEISPGGDGLRGFAVARLPEGARNRYKYKDIEIEIYSVARFMTITGNHLDGTPTEVDEEHGQAQLTALLARLDVIEDENTGVVCGVVPSTRKGTRASKAPTATTLAAPIALEDLSLDDQVIWTKATQAGNGQNFLMLWNGDDPKHRMKNDGSANTSAADFDLILQLLYWTDDDAEQTERLFRASKRYRAKTDRRTNGVSHLSYEIKRAMERRYQVRPQRRGIGSAEEIPAATPAPVVPTGPARQLRRIKHTYPWMHRQEETPEQRQQSLQEVAKQVADQIWEHIITGNRSLKVANVAPGVGKSTTVAPLGLSAGYGGGDLDLAWIAERKNMVESVAALQQYRQIQPCTRYNCSDHALHNALGSRGYNAWSVHKRHKLQCQYAKQFTKGDSAVYQLAHVAARYPAQHQGIIIDELDLTKWLPEREITIDKLTSALKVYRTGSTADQLLRAIEATITDAMQARQHPHGLQLFKALNRRCGGQLENWIGELAQDPKYTNTHPWYEIEEEDEAAQDLEVATLAPVILPHILVAFMRELVQWQLTKSLPGERQEWNSCLRVGPGRQGWALYISERRRFTPDGDNKLPARAILDATADAELLTRLFGEEVQLQQAEIEPPAGTRHIAVRTGKRYGKMSLTVKRKDGTNKDQQRAIAEARYILRALNPDGSKSVGLITFQGCVDEMAEALNIPKEHRLHFWAARGSNALEGCEILLVIGTPTVAPATVARLARALWQDDPKPISEESIQDEATRIRQFIDPRMQRLNDYLTRSELTQCAHRSRPLRQARTVVTFCLPIKQIDAATGKAIDRSIDYLPATETITDLPQLTPDGQDLWKLKQEETRQRLDQARKVLEEQGKTLAMINIRDLKALAHVRTETAGDYLRELRGEDQGQEEVEHHTPHTHLCSQQSNLVPTYPIRDYIERPGTKTGTNDAPPTGDLQDDGQPREKQIIRDADGNLQGTIGYSTEELINMWAREMEQANGRTMREAS